jgi:uncharacterized protein YjbI with pentapeptide repeats
MNARHLGRWAVTDTGRIFAEVGGLFALGVFASSPVMAAADCVTMQQFSTDNKPFGKTLLCSPLFLQNALLFSGMATLTEQIAGNAAETKKLQSFVAQLNGTAKSLTDKQLSQLAMSLAPVINRAVAQAVEKSSEEKFAQIREITSQLEAANQLLAGKLTDAASAESTRAALGGKLGDALSWLDFTQARDLMSRIDQHLEGLDDRDKIERAIALRAVGDTGHIASIEKHIGDVSFAGRDLSGLYLARGRLDAIDLQKASLVMAKLEAASLRGGKLQEARLHALDAAGANLEGADLSYSVGEAMNLSQAHLAKAKLVMASWALADLRQADLRGADMRGMSLAFADMRDADLRGARLEGAFLGGADLRGAKLDGAFIEDTDVALAAIDSNSPLAKPGFGACATPTRGSRQGAWIRANEEGGRGRIFEQEIYTDQTHDGALPVCTNKRWQLWDTKKPWPVAPVVRHSEFGWDVLTPSSGLGFRYSHDLLESGGRRADLVARLAGRAKQLQMRFQEPVVWGDTSWRSRQLITQLRDQLKAAPSDRGPTAPVMGQEAFLLYLLKLSGADLWAQVDWMARAQARFSREVYLRKWPHNHDGNAWPNWFTDEMVATDFGPSVAETARQRTRDAVSRLSGRAFVKLGRTYPKSAELSLATYASKAPIDEAALPTQLLYERNRLYWMPFTFELARGKSLRGALRFPQPLKRMAIPEAFQASEARSLDGALDLGVDVKGVSLQGEIVVIDVVPLNFRLRPSDPPL